MTAQLQFSLTTSAFRYANDGTRFAFPDPLGNAYELGKDATKAEFFVVNGWIGRPGDVIAEHVVIRNPRGTSVVSQE